MCISVDPGGHQLMWVFMVPQMSLKEARTVFF